MQKIIQLVHPTQAELDDAFQLFESSCASAKLHDVARRGLSNSDVRLRTEPFPKVEIHDSYVYGVLASPTDVDDAKSEYFNIHFVVNTSMALTVVWGVDETDAERRLSLSERISFTSSEENSESAPGDCIVRIATVVIEDLENVLTDLHGHANLELEELESELFNLDGLSESSADIAERYQKVSLLKFEILSMNTTVEETKNVLFVLDQLDVVSEGSGVLFSQNQQISINDLLMRSRSLKAQRADLEDEVRLIFDRLESIENQRQTEAQLRLGSVASILLLPALIVGFFGQNFNDNPWSDTDWAWMVNAGGLAAIAAAQFIFYKRKKWL
jgi:Mg2+ and Co2+ transporter CorA